MVAIVFCATSWSASADLAPPPKLNCNDANSNHEMIACARAEYAAADKQLNSTYKKTIARMREIFTREDIANAGGQDPVEDLRDAQRAWIVFRDANCRWEATQMLGGSGQPLVLHGCLARMTKERVEAFENYLKEE
jgi:uncharacterized protein YecT (DUF1311 family)